MEPDLPDGGLRMGSARGGASVPSAVGRGGIVTGSAAPRFGCREDAG